MIKAMCRLSCQICEQAEGFENNKEFVKRGHVFKSLDLLRRHIPIAHKVQMCGLCLEGRKVSNSSLHFNVFEHQVFLCGSVVKD